MFRNRADAGERLAEKLEMYQNTDTVVFALPRGGIETALPIAHTLRSPLWLIVPRKIGHPLSPEFAIAAISESGDMLANESVVAEVDPEWLEIEKKKQMNEAKRRRELYLQNVEPVSVEGKIGIIVDDGVATGLTMRVAVRELKRMNPRKIIVAVPVISRDAAIIISKEVDELVVLLPPEEFCGAVGAYYESFPQVEDKFVIALMKKYDIEFRQKFPFPKPS